MGRVRVFLILIISLAVLPAAIVARAAPGIPADLVLHMSADTDGAHGTLSKRKGPCSRSLLPMAPCVATFALPPVAAGDAFLEARAETYRIVAELPLSDLAQSCILGPPRSS